MRKVILLSISLFLSACVQLPVIEPVKGEPAARVTVSKWLFPLLGDAKSTRLLMCDVETPRQTCDWERRGLNAGGVGGFILPLKVSLPVATIAANRADVHVAVNGIGAVCTTGSVKTSEKDAFLEISNVFCNWLVIGNVFSNLKLSFDWDDPATRMFGGRYVISFFGTGNGYGSGIYSAKVQS